MCITINNGLIVDYLLAIVKFKWAKGYLKKHWAKGYYPINANPIFYIEQDLSIVFRRYSLGSPFKILPYGFFLMGWKYIF